MDLKDIKLYAGAPPPFLARNRKILIATAPTKFCRGSDNAEKPDQGKC